MVENDRILYLLIYFYPNLLIILTVNKIFLIEENLYDKVHITRK